MRSLKRSIHCNNKLFVQRSLVAEFYFLTQVFAPEICLN